ncbi:MAG: hypothetical protein JRN62_03240 [Nitrososphaerota archaeon]|jgi:hypothetical protein|nr:hypothetical protein [Nitrososphaerota archaeon]
MCDRLIEKPDTKCPDAPEFKTKIGLLWGHYCGEHMLEFMRSDNYAPGDDIIYPEEYEVEENEYQ